jgi:hypothetical protein
MTKVGRHRYPIKAAGMRRRAAHCQSSGGRGRLVVMAILKGRGQLRALPPGQDIFEVDYEIHIGSKPLGRNAVGLPPVTSPTIEATTRITTVDGRQIPDPGQHVLMNERGAEVLRLAKDFGKWYGLNP